MDSPEMAADALLADLVKTLAVDYDGKIHPTARCRERVAAALRARDEAHAEEVKRLREELEKIRHKLASALNHSNPRDWAEACRYGADALAALTPKEAP